MGILPGFIQSSFHFCNQGHCISKWNDIEQIEKLVSLQFKVKLSSITCMNFSVNIQKCQWTKCWWTNYHFKKIARVDNMLISFGAE